MKFHWYWPFARAEELAWAQHTVRPGERLDVQVIDRPEAPEAGTQDGVTVRRNLPDVDRSATGARWAVSRAATYRTRARARRSLWESESFDLVHLHYVNRFTDAVIRLPHPLVMSVHDVVPHRLRLGDFVEHRLLSRLYHRPDALVVHHDRLRQRLVAEFDVSESCVHVVPHQVFPVDVPPTPELPIGPPHILFFGALRPNKGLDVLLDALGLLAGTDLRVTIAGRGDTNLEQQARDVAAGDGRVSAEIGFASLQRKRELFRAATIVVLPYTAFASQSGVLHDAYGHGRPVVVTDVGALGETVTDDQTGLVVPPNDTAALAEAIVEQCQPSSWTPAAANCRTIAHQRSPEATGRRLREVYDLLLP